MNPLTLIDTAVVLRATRWRATLAEALDAWSSARPGGTALAWSSTWCGFATVADGRLAGPDGATVAIEGVFEARVFDAEVELRWLHDAGGVGDAVALSEAPLAAGLAPDGCERLDTPFPAAIDGVRYLLWGGDEPAEALTGPWVERRTGRVGILRVPHSDSALAAREYVAYDDDTGAATVAEERLVGFAPAVGVDPDDEAPAENEDDA